VSALAERLNMPQENLITPDTVRRVCWEPPAPLTPDTVSRALTAHGARPWQIEQVTPLLVRALGR
jgi:ribonuclease D